MRKGRMSRDCRLPRHSRQLGRVHKIERIERRSHPGVRALEQVQVGVEWANLTRSFAPAEAVDAVADARARFEAGTLPQADHDALVASINARTRHIETPKSAKVSFDTKLATARADNGTSVDLLTDAQFAKLWDSVR